LNPDITISRTKPGSWISVCFSCDTKLLKLPLTYRFFGPSFPSSSSGPWLSSLPSTQNQFSPVTPPFWRRQMPRLIQLTHKPVRHTPAASLQRSC
jgi:hypothetical protein